MWIRARKCGASLELEAQAELHDARVVGAIEDQEAAARAAWITGIEGTAAVGGSKASSAGANAPAEGVELGVIEHVEGFPAEFKRIMFLKGETLEEAEIEIQAARHPELIALHIAEGQAGGQLKSGGVEGQHSEACLGLLGSRNNVGITNEIEARRRESPCFGDASIVAVCGTVDDVERQPGLDDSDAGSLPPAE